jgi:hypothetical protein
MKESGTVSNERAPKGSQPKVFAVVLNWNGLKDTMECIESLRNVTYGNLDVIVIDNGSVGGEADTIEEKCGDWITVLRNQENLGYAEGNNVGIRYALAKNAEYVLLLNNDVIVAPDFLDAMISVTESRREVGIVGPMIYYYPPNQGEEVIWFAGGRVAKNIGQPFHIGLKEIDTGQFNRLKVVDYITGCALLIKKEAISKIGLLDTEYFAYFEDLDWNMRAHAVGFLSMFVPEARIWHKASATSGYMSPVYVYLHTRNRILFVRKNTSRLGFALFFLPTFVVLRIARPMIMFIAKGQNKANRALIQGLKDGMFGAGKDIQGRIKVLMSNEVRR